MSYRRHRKKGEVPEELYVITNGTTFRTYTDLPTARGVVTRELNYHKKTKQRIEKQNPTWDGDLGWKPPYILKAEITSWEVVE